jgi:hypothetical protein
MIPLELIDRPEGALTATDEIGVSDPFPMLKNCTRFEPVSPTARIPNRVSISTALGLVPAGTLVVPTEGGVAE